jgi:hypothetical protein
LSERQVERRGLDVQDGSDVGDFADEEWKFNPADVDLEEQVGGRTYPGQLAADLQQELDSYETPDPPDG